MRLTKLIFRRAGCGLMALLLTLVAGCMAADVDTPCSRDLECASGLCEDGLCTQRCAQNTDCAGAGGKSICTWLQPPPDDGQPPGRCHYRLPVLALNYGSPSETDAWTSTHDQGLQQAAERLQFVRLAQEVYAGDGAASLSWTRKNNQKDKAPGGLRAEVDQWVNEQRREHAGKSLVVLTNSVNQSEDLEQIANDYATDANPNHKDVIFINVAGFRINEYNLGTAFAHMERAWYAAGWVAAQKALAESHGERARIGFVAPIPTAEVIRHISAFTLGAQALVARDNLASHDKTRAVDVIVRWLGAWSGRDISPEDCPRWAGDSDYQPRTSEACLAAGLLELGCKVLAHHLDNQRVIESVAAWSQSGAPLAYTIGNDHRFACRRGLRQDGEPYAGCLGSVYWNWAPLYEEIFTQIHRHEWTPGLAILEDNGSQEATVGFAVNPQASEDETHELTKRVEAAFAAISPNEQYQSDRVFSGFCWKEPDPAAPGSSTQVCPLLDADCLTDKGSRAWLELCKFPEGVMEPCVQGGSGCIGQGERMGLRAAQIPAAAIQSGQAASGTFLLQPSVESERAFCLTQKAKMPERCVRQSHLRRPLPSPLSL